MAAEEWEEVEDGYRYWWERNSMSVIAVWSGELTCWELQADEADEVESLMAEVELELMEDGCWWERIGDTGMLVIAVWSGELTCWELQADEADEIGLGSLNLDEAGDVLPPAAEMVGWMEMDGWLVGDGWLGLVRSDDEEDEEAGRW